MARLNVGPFFCRSGKVVKDFLTDQKKIAGIYWDLLNEAIAGIGEGKDGQMPVWRRKGAKCPGCGGEVVAVIDR